jgi:hypothetical protein
MTDAQNAKWPDGVRSVSHDDIGVLGIDQEGASIGTESPLSHDHD